MDRFVTKKARVKPAVNVVVPRARTESTVTAAPEPAPLPSASPPRQGATADDMDAVVEEDISDRDEAFDRYWEEKAGKRQEVRAKRKKMEAAPHTIVEHFAVKKT
jgi:hypothetical protein